MGRLNPMLPEFVVLHVLLRSPSDNERSWIWLLSRLCISLATNIWLQFSSMFCAFQSVLPMELNGMLLSLCRIKYGAKYGPTFTNLLTMLVNLELTKQLMLPYIICSKQHN